MLDVKGGMLIVRRGEFALPVSHLTSHVRHRVILGVLLVFLAQPSTVFSQWVSVGDGIDYASFAASGPNNLFVSRMTRSNANTTIDTSIALDMMSGAKEIVRNQAARQDDAISWWGGSWGARNKVVVAINGGFYDTTTGVIDGGQIQSGWYAHWFADRGSFSGFAWKTDRTAFHGECVDHTAANVYVKLGRTKHYFEVEVKDDGRGITESQRLNSRSLGLLGMKERALLVGGDVRVTGKEGAGTTVVVRVAL